MSKSKEELDALKEEVEDVNEKLQELSKEELDQINGGTSAMQGQVPGVQIASTDGQPGSRAKTRVRGGRSLNASNDPLDVVD